MKNDKLKLLLQEHLNDFKLGANFSDVGYLANSNFLTSLKKIKVTRVSGKDYGEVTHWDPFLQIFKNYLYQNYADPMLEAPELVAFLMGVASHRVSDDIWHNHEDDSAAPVRNSATYPFASCNKSPENSCYFGTISKIADIEALNWQGFEGAHDIADRGIEYAIINDKKLTLKDAPKDWNALPTKMIIAVLNNPIVQDSYRELKGNYKELVVTEDDIKKDANIYKDLVINGVYALAAGGGLGVLQKLHKMDWIRSHYETDKDVGLNPIEVQVAKFADDFFI